ncbi:tape measure protein [Rhizobium paknamense]|uniref:Tape measure domain-containing protein n=1 Tax=Rhizobium paknamense TaxID=1206817 RepID=A0ABU0ICS8_9HYPH|nr:tape measure protein [Rhizobium paknamense]MDQ0456048.1 tape measure domain-containing protein [Rhizobium paknamense]
MATDLERLVVQLSADIKGYQREMLKAANVTNAQARAIENRMKALDGRFSALGTSMARGLTAPLAGISAALTVDTVMHYADAWTSAKNSLAVAGVVGNQQVAVLDQIYNSAQRNAAPIGAMADLFGKAAQAGDALGASQADLLTFTDGVGTALKIEGKSATEAQGALTQLGQLLGSARVQAEEFNSVNEGARPILMAVANGLDAAGGSVSKLKQLVNDGEVSNRDFFQAFLKGLPTIQSMAANATQTIEQGVTKVNNAFTRYIGQTDEGLGASQRLVTGLNALADHFGETADVVLKLAAAIAGALVGRSMVSMISTMVTGASAVMRLVTALRAASSAAGVATAIGGIGAAAGPLGVLIGGTVAGALALFSSSSDEASTAAKTYAKALAEVEAAANKTAPAVEGMAKGINEKTRNLLTAGVDEGVSKIGEAKTAVLDLFDSLFQNVDRDTISPDQLKQLEDLRDRLDQGKISAKDADEALYALANSNPSFQAVADAFSPLLDQLQKAIEATGLLKKQLGEVSAIDPKVTANYQQYAQSRAQGEEMVRLGKAYADEAQRQNTLSKEQLAVEKEIARIKADLKKNGGFLTDDEIKSLAQSNVAADERRSKSGSKEKVPRATADDRLDMDIQSIRDRTAALIEEQSVVGQSYREQEKRRMALDLEAQALQDVREEARRKGDQDWQNAKLSPEQIDKIKAASEAYAEQADALRKVQEAQERAESAAQDFYNTFKDGMIDAITGAESFEDALANVGKKLADLFLNSAFDSLFSGATGSGGWLTNAFKAVGFASGGYTGPGGKYEPAGVVHKGEYVFDQASVRAAGGPAALDAMRSRLKGYSSGGYVGSAPRMPNLSQAASSRGGSVQLTYAPQNDFRGASAETVAQLKQQQDQDRKLLEARVVSIVKNARQRGVQI